MRTTNYLDKSNSRIQGIKFCRVAKRRLKNQTMNWSLKPVWRELKGAKQAGGSDNNNGDQDKKETIFQENGIHREVNFSCPWL